MVSGRFLDPSYSHNTHDQQFPRSWWEMWRKKACGSLNVHGIVNEGHTKVLEWIRETSTLTSSSHRGLFSMFNAKLRTSMDKCCTFSRRKTVKKLLLEQQWVSQRAKNRRKFVCWTFESSSHQKNTGESFMWDIHGSVNDERGVDVEGTVNRRAATRSWGAKLIYGLYVVFFTIQ